MFPHALSRWCLECIVAAVTNPSFAQRNRGTGPLPGFQQTIPFHPLPPFTVFGQPGQQRPTAFNPEPSAADSPRDRSSHWGSPPFRLRSHKHGPRQRFIRPRSFGLRVVERSGEVFVGLSGRVGSGVRFAGDDVLWLWNVGLVGFLGKEKGVRGGPKGSGGGGGRGPGGRLGFAGAEFKRSRRRFSGGLDWAGGGGGLVVGTGYGGCGSGRGGRRAELAVGFLFSMPTSSSSSFEPRQNGRAVGVVKDGWLCKRSEVGFAGWESSRLPPARYLRISAWQVHDAVCFLKIPYDVKSPGSKDARSPFLGSLNSHVQANGTDAPSPNQAD